RLLEIAAQECRGAELEEALPLVPLPAKRQAQQAVRLVEPVVEPGRALVLAHGVVVLTGLGERLAELEMRPAVGRVRADVLLQDRNRLVRLLQREVDGAQRPIDPAAVPEVARALERDARVAALADELVHPSEQELALRIVRLLLGLLAVERRHQ